MTRDLPRKRLDQKENKTEWARQFFYWQKGFIDCKDWQVGPKFVQFLAVRSRFVCVCVLSTFIKVCVTSFRFGSCESLKVESLIKIRSIGWWIGMCSPAGLVPPGWIINLRAPPLIRALNSPQPAGRKDVLKRGRQRAFLSAGLG